MVSNTKEIALEQAIQKHLTGFTSEELAGQPQPDSPDKFRIGLPQDFDAQYALDTKLFWQFLEDTQPTSWTSCVSIPRTTGSARCWSALTGSSNKRACYIS